MPETGSSSSSGTPGSDTRAGTACAAVFSVALGLVSVAVPLFALARGYSATEVGLLVALSATSQLGSRLFMGRMMRRLPDKVFVVAAGAILALSSVLLLMSSAWIVFAASQLLQGVSRAFFWTGSQTHAVRMSTSAVGALARVNLASGVGQLVGPVLAGLLAERSLEWALTLSAVFGALAVVPAAFLVRLPPFVKLEHDRNARRVWRRPGVVHACSAAGTAGAWRGLLNSYVPVVLDQARVSSSLIGVLVAVANAASVVGSALTGKVTTRGARLSLIVGVLATGLGMGAVGPLATLTVACAVALTVSGLGAGALQTVGPAIAAETVHPEERGEAIASSGVFRASALFLAPLGVAALVTVLPMGAALAAAGALIAAPAVMMRGLGRSQA